MNVFRKRKMLSVVIPTYKSEANLPLLTERLAGVLQSLEYDYEIIVVNDCSPDGTLELLRELRTKFDRLKVISLSRNFGQQAATSAGLRYAHGDAVMIMDDDLQDPPEFIRTLVRKWEEGYSVVYAVRSSRKEGVWKQFGYKAFYRVLAAWSDINIPRDSGDFGLVDRVVVNLLNRMPEKGRFLRGLRAWAGFKQIGVDCPRQERLHGKPAYGIVKVFRLAADGMFAFSTVPLRMFTAAGVIVSGMAFLGALLTFAQWLLTRIWPGNIIAVWPGFGTIVLSVLFLGGVQLLGIGVLGEYIGRIYNEVKCRPLYVVEEAIGFDDSVNVTLNVPEDMNPNVEHNRGRFFEERALS